MDRRSFLGLLVKVAGAAVVLPYIQLPETEFNAHPSGTENYVRRRIIEGNLDANKIKCFIRSDKGVVQAPCHAKELKIEGGALFIVFNAFEVDESFTLGSYVFVDEHGWILADRTAVIPIAVNPGDHVRVTYELRLT